MFRKKPNFFYKKNVVVKLFLPLSWLYSFVFLILNIRLMRPKKIGKKVVCVGNIVVGGTGKTPLSCAICDVLQQRDKKVCFITKGYGRTLKKTITIPVKHGDIFHHQETGDEALLLSDHADTFVVNKRDAAKCGTYDVVICDDGFFDNSIHKDCQIVVFDGSFFVGNSYTLPIGPLRAGLRSLKHADFVIIANANQDFEKQSAILQRYLPAYKILQAHSHVASVHDKNKRYFAFSGLGENSKFINSLKQYGLDVVDSMGFEDHCNYNAEIFKRLEEAINRSGATGVITTAKDYVKIPKEVCAKFNLEVLEISYSITDVSRIVEFIGQDV